MRSHGQLGMTLVEVLAALALLDAGRGDVVVDRLHRPHIR